VTPTARRRTRKRRDPQAERQFVEDTGILFEQHGVPRMAGRIIGRLLLCDPPHQTLPDLASYLGASMGSISTMTRLLEQVGLLDRIGLPGERKVLFRIRSEAWSGLMDDHAEHVRNLRVLAERGLALPGTAASSARRERLEEMREVGAFYEDRFPELQARFAAQLAALHKAS